MKKFFFPLLVCVCVLGLGAQAFAADNETDPGTSFTVGDGNDNNLVFNFSPGVSGQYQTIGTTSNEQWFSIGTYHGGGNLFYATSADQTIVWKKDRSTDQAFTDAAIPGEPLGLDANDKPLDWDSGDSGWYK